MWTVAGAVVRCGAGDGCKDVVWCTFWVDLCCSRVIIGLGSGGPARFFFSTLFFLNVPKFIFSGMYGYVCRNMLFWSGFRQVSGSDVVFGGWCRCECGS
jgi:hypothetical protein